MNYIIDMDSTHAEIQKTVTMLWRWLQLEIDALVRVDVPSVEVWEDLEDLARAYMDPAEHCVVFSGPYYRINKARFQAEIIAHELAHIAAARAFGDEGHGKGWQVVMSILQLAPITHYKVRRPKCFCK